MSQQQESASKQEGKLSVELITPVKIVYEGPADEVTVPGSMGHIGVLPGHDPILVTLAIGAIKCRFGEKEEQYYCGGGFMQVNEDTVRMLVEVSEKAENIDRERATEARKRAEDRISNSSSDADIDVARAELALHRALMRLEISSEH